MTVENNRGLVSVIVPVYNAAQYLEECVMSVLNQTIGREKIQLILVDNGSEDGSREACEHWQTLHPSSVLSVHIESNIGPSGARKAGLAYAKGEYITFLDADDKWEPDAFAHMCAFFAEHPGEVDFIAPRVQNFGSNERWHTAYTIPGEDAVMDIHDNYECIATSLRGFFRASALALIEMNTRVQDVDGVLYVTAAVLQKGRFGISGSAVYRMRRGQGGASGKLRSRGNRSKYVRDFEALLLGLMKESRIRYGAFLPYVQFLVMHLIKIRMSAPLPKWMDREEQSVLIKGIQAFLQKIDDRIIAEQEGFFKERKIYCLRMKYGNDVWKKFELRRGEIWFHNVPWFRLRDRSICRCRRFGARGGMLWLSGVLNLPLSKGSYEVFVMDSDGRDYPLQFDETGERKQKCLGQVIHILRPFRVEVPLRLGQGIRMMFRCRYVETPLTITLMGRAMDTLRIFSIRELSSFVCDEKLEQ